MDEIERRHSDFTDSQKEFIRETFAQIITEVHICRFGDTMTRERLELAVLTAEEIQARQKEAGKIVRVTLIGLFITSFFGFLVWAFAHKILEIAGKGGGT